MSSIGFFTKNQFIPTIAFSRKTRCVMSILYKLLNHRGNRMKCLIFSTLMMISNLAFAGQVYIHNSEFKSWMPVKNVAIVYFLSIPQVHVSLGEVNISFDMKSYEDASALAQDLLRPQSLIECERSGNLTWADPAYPEKKICILRSVRL